MHFKKHSIGISLLVTLMLFTCICVGSSGANSSSIYDIRISYGDKVRVVLDLSKNIQPKTINFITNPEKCKNPHIKIKYLELIVLNVKILATHSELFDYIRN